MIPGRELTISEHCAVCYNRTATSFVSACSKYSCTIGVTVFSKSLSSSGRTNVSYTQFSCQSITSVTELQVLHSKYARCSRSRLVIPEHRHSWGPSYPPPQVHKPHQICPTRLCLQPRLQEKVRETKLHNVLEEKQGYDHRCNASMMYSPR